jgi:ABC-type branched-subunit amino acid transport system substrate-binding protein
MAEKAEKPMISLAANAKIVEGSKWVFKTAQNDRVVLEKMVDDMKAKGITKVAVARDASGFGEGIPEMLTDIGKAAGITVVKVEKFAPDATDFTSQMISLRAQPAGRPHLGHPAGRRPGPEGLQAARPQRAGLPVARHRQPGLPRHRR